MQMIAWFGVALVGFVAGAMARDGLRVRAMKRQLEAQDNILSAWRSAAISADRELEELRLKREGAKRCS